MWIRSDLKMKAKQAFKKNYWAAVVVSLILAVILASGGSSGNNDKDNLSISRYTQSVGENGNVAVTGVTYALNVFEPLRVLTAPLRAMMGLVTVSMKVLLVVLLIILKILIFNGLEVGGRGFYIENTYSNPGIGRIFGAFRSGSVGNVVKVTFFRDLYLILWSLMLIVPGIVKSYEYRMIPYLLAEYPDMPQEEAFRRSREMMYGNKWKAFVLDLSFIPWLFLSEVTFGLVEIFYVRPYMDATNAELYETLSQMNVN